MQHQYHTTLRGNQFHGPIIPEHGGCALVLEKYKTQITEKFIKQARELVPAAQNKNSSAIRNAIPEFIEEFIVLLSPLSKVSAAKKTLDVSLEHGKQRAELQRYTIEQTLHEYTILRSIIFETLFRETDVTIEESNVIHEAFQKTMTDAASAFAKAHAQAAKSYIASLESLLASAPMGIAYLDENFRYIRINEALAKINRVPVAANTGVTVGVGATVSNVTELKNTQDVAKRLAREFELVTSVVSVQLSHYDREERIISVNKPLRDFWNLSEIDVIGKTISEITGAEQYEKIKAPIKKVLSGETLSFEQSLTNSEGSSQTFLINYTPDLDAQGQVAGFICSATDISELKQAREELERFAAIAAHDLKSPVHSITQFTELLAENYRGRLDENADKYIKFILKAGDRMVKLVDNLLEYARAGKLDESKFEIIDTFDTVKVVKENLHSSIEKTNANIHVSPSLPTVFGHKLQITQLFQNLIANAIKFHKPDQPPQIYIDCEEEAFFWRFGIRDEGLGIEPSFKDKMFTAFSKFHSTSQPSTLPCQNLK